MDLALFRDQVSYLETAFQVQILKRASKRGVMWIFSLAQVPARHMAKADTKSIHFDVKRFASPQRILNIAVEYSMGVTRGIVVCMTNVHCRCGTTATVDKSCSSSVAYFCQFIVESIASTAIVEY